MPRGGGRAGRQGTAYAQRSDLQKAQPVRAAPSQQYGAREAQEQAQRAVPLPAAAPSASPRGGPMARGGRPAPVAGGLGPLDRPSARPGEPITAGMPMGAGPTAPGPTVDPTLEALRAAYRLAPNEQVAELIEAIEARSR